MSKTDCYTCKKLVDDDVCEIGGIPSFLKEDCPYYESKHKKQTNFDRIKAMSVKQMAEWLAKLSNGICTICDEGQDSIKNGCEIGFAEEICAYGIKQWLQQEAEDD